MPTLAERGAAALIRRAKQTNGVAVTYTRGATAVPLTAVRGLTTATSQELPGRVEVSDRDYLLAVADLVAAGLFPPAIGDRVAEAINGAAKTFEAMTPETGEPVWRYCNELRGAVRLHTKAV